jgi:hypothetical protein
MRVATLRQRPTILIMVLLVEGFVLSLALHRGQVAGSALALPLWPVVESGLVLLAVAAWPLLAIRATRRPNPSLGQMARVHVSAPKPS